MKILLRALLVLALLPARMVFAEADDSYAQALIARAEALGLADFAQWHALVHYRSNLMSPGVTGQADDPAFYLAPNGKHDPHAELAATLRAFFTPAAEDAQDSQDHPQCRFVARYDWLSRTLDFDSKRLPVQFCARFHAWRDALQASELTLVFPSAYINNPSSMFGHTLLRVDGAGQDERTRLLAYAINYAVDPGSDGQVSFIVKSLTGFYPGEFSIAPYYFKVKEYSDLENRDLWEYRLNFTPEEIDRLLMHAWELAFTHFDYYFFDENCAYHLLSLFEVARPGLELSNQFRGWVIPVDTVRAVVAQPGLLKEVVYRPASNTRLRERIAALNADEQARLRRLSAGESPDAVLTAEVPLARQALLLETAYALLRHETARGQYEAKVAALRSRELLLARSRLPQEFAESASSDAGDGESSSAIDDWTLTTPAVRPDQGHPTRRIALGGGRDGGENFFSLVLRPAYNDVLDPPGGYAEGAQINFLDIGLRYNTESDHARLEYVALIDVLSLTPRNDFFKPISWRLGTGFVRRLTDDSTQALVWRNQAGAGLAWGSWDSVLGYGMLQGVADVSHHLDHGYAVGAGAQLGLYLRPLPAWKAHLYVRTLDYVPGDHQRERELGLEQSVSFGVRNALRLTLSERREAGTRATLVMLAWHGYF
ncbi:MAG: DUF4105 domain-containing protein [Chromatiales bacterium]|nr:DUF4105 domain-containing protein [Chromatiales bacterium]